MRALRLQVSVDPGLDFSRAKGMARREEGVRHEVARPNTRARVAGGIPTQVREEEYQANIALAAALKQEEEERRAARRAIAPPAFLGGQYKPRNLSILGGEFMRDLDPEGPRMRKIRRRVDRELAYLGADPLGGGSDPRASLDSRYDYLARRYTGLDLVRKGLAFEVLGRFYPREARDRSATIRKVQEERFWSAGWAERQAPFDEQDLRIWLAMGRRVCWDQVFALSPATKPGLFQMIQDLEQHGEVKQVEMAFGRGHLDGLSLTRKGWKAALSRDPDLSDRGFGPLRKTILGQEYHDLAVTDAIQYGTHLAEADGAKVLGVTLEDGLKREAPDRQAGVADFRLELLNKFGTQTLLEIEVMGLSNHYGAIRREASSAGLVRLGYDPLGRPGPASSIIRIGR